MASRKIPSADDANQSIDHRALQCRPLNSQAKLEVHNLARTVKRVARSFDPGLSAELLEVGIPPGASQPLVASIAREQHHWMGVRVSKQARSQHVQCAI